MTLERGARRRLLDRAEAAIEADEEFAAELNRQDLAYGYGFNRDDGERVLWLYQGDTVVDKMRLSMERP